VKPIFYALVIIGGLLIYEAVKGLKAQAASSPSASSGSGSGTLSPSPTPAPGQCLATSGLPASVANVLTALATQEGYCAGASPNEQRANNPFGVMGGPNLGWNQINQPSGTTYLQVYPNQQAGVQAAISEFQNNPRYSGAFSQLLQTGNGPAFLQALQNNGWAGTPADSPGWLQGVTSIYNQLTGGANG